MAISANKIKSIRAAVCYNMKSTRLSRQHNNANIIALGSRLTKKKLSLKLVEEFLKLKLEFIGDAHIEIIGSWFGFPLIEMISNLFPIKQIDIYDKTKNLCLEKNGAFLYSANFSLGMNIFFEINKQIAEIMKSYKYKCEVNEVHHIQKIDSPSGTALVLKEDIQKIYINQINQIKVKCLHQFYPGLASIRFRYKKTFCLW